MNWRFLVLFGVFGGAFAASGGCLEWQLPEGPRGDAGMDDGGPPVDDAGGDADDDPREGVFPHSEDYDEGAVHGGDANERGLGLCQPCHGDSLEGGIGPSCEGCHGGWQTRCTFCHGGGDNETGAPPAGASGASAPTDLSVGAHTSHVENTDVHVGRECTSCHVMPDSALSPGHIDGDRRAEVIFDGLSPGATYDPASGTCSDLYCHGNGNGGLGSLAWTSTQGLSCGSCHASRGSPVADLVTMSGSHVDHAEVDVSCAACHSSVTDGGAVITGLALHVDGSVDVSLDGSANDVTWDGSTCTGTCHSELHSGTGW